jgi:hypothetical protein
MRILTLTALIALAGCASQNGPGTSSPAAADAAAQPAEAPVAQFGSTEAAEATAAEAPKSAFRPPPGYKRRPNMGEDVYCAKLTVLGSRFPKDDCRTEAQLRELERQRESTRDALEQRRSVCTSSGGCRSQ